MKKIMFNDRYGLTQAVLDGKKTMTRRVIKDIEIDWVRRGRVTLSVGGFENDTLLMDVRSILRDAGISDYSAPAKYQPRYERGEEVAVAQSYESIGLTFINPPDTQWGCTNEMPGYSNKMFVRPDLMPHCIKITDIKAERLQDISDEDCLKEGLIAGEQEPRMFGFRLPKGTILSFLTPRAAFAALIDRISGKGTWQRNPWVFVYEFELLK